MHLIAQEKRMEATHRKMEVEREERKEREANISSGGGQLV